MDIVKKLRFIFNKRQKREIFGLFIIICIGSALELLCVSFFSPLINGLMNPMQIQDNGVYRFFYNFIHVDSTNAMVVVLLLLLVFMYFLKNAFLIFMYNTQFKFVFNNERVLADRMFKCYISQPYLFHVSKNSAELLRNINEDTGNFFGALQAGIRLLTEVMVCIVLGIYLFILDKTITIAVVCLLFITFGASASIYKKLLVKMGARNRLYSTLRNKWVHQAFGGIKEVKILNKEEFFDKKYDEAYRGHASSEYKYHTMLAIPKPIIETLCIVGMMGAVTIKYLRGASIAYFVPVISVFAVAAFRLLPSFNRITEYIGQIMYHKSAINSIYNDLKEVDELHENNIQATSESPISFNDRICINSISFLYPNTDEMILDHLSLDIEKNTSIALIGASGAGKTTMADIIMGLINPCKGDVTVDGVSIFDNIKEWHSIIGYIPQNIYLMDDTIRNNIAFGIDEKDIDIKKLNYAIERAQLSDLISQLENGIDTEIGECGIRLSGGQRQRIGIARALYNEPQILILDEATSALDNDTEVAVMSAIESLHGQVTLIIIAHRLSTIESCDAVYEVRNRNITKVR